VDFSVFLSSSAVAGLVAALVAVRNSERKIQVENVTGERAKWRGAMRKLAESLLEAAHAGNQQDVSLHCSQLALNLNPFDAEDKVLVIAAKQLASAENREAQAEEFTTRMALLLKHDWDRAKREAQPWFYRGKEPRRVPYCEYACNKSAAISPATAPRKRGSLALYFLTLSFSAGIIFFLAVGLTEPFHELVKIFNDPTIEKPIGAWAQFVSWSVLCGSIWSAAYLWFKGSEKKFLEIWFGK
jgi:hypothetical protein